jgi:L-lysine exporter family protein LysE/ArgO
LAFSLLVITMTELFFSGFALSLSLCLDLGIVNVAAFSTAATRGARAAFVLGIGSCFGDLAYAVIAMLGVATLLHIVAVRWALWLGGSAVLLYLAVKMLRQSIHASALLAKPETGDGNPAGLKQKLAGDFGKGFAMAIASPSAILWFASVGGSLIATTAGGAGNGAWPFFLGFFICGVIWSAVVALVGSRIHKSAERAGFAQAFTRGLAGFSALLFLALALKVMIDGYRTLL